MCDTNPDRRPGASSTTLAPPMVRRGLRARLFAWGLAHNGDADRRLYGVRKRALFAQAVPSSGQTVVEIGAGTGPNAAYLPAGTRWLVAEPNVHAHPHVQRAADEHGLDLTLLAGDAEHLPLADGSADAVVSTLVLCSVPDPARALAEARRVLRPGGTLVFIEHVAAPDGSRLRWLQRVLRVPWGIVADGCRPDRDTEAALLAAGFARIEVERFRAPLGPVAPHIAGLAVR